MHQLAGALKVQSPAQKTMRQPQKPSSHQDAGRHGSVTADATIPEACSKMEANCMEYMPANVSTTSTVS